MTHYDDVIMPLKARFGSSTVPLTATDVIMMDSGFRKANSRWSQYLRTLSLSYLDDTAILEEIQRVFMAIGGPANSFLARDWADWNTTAGRMRSTDASAFTKDDQSLQNTVTSLFVGDGTTKTFQMVKRYVNGSASHTRTIKKPQGNPLIAVNGALQTLTTDYSFDATTGIVTFVAAPSAGVTVTWGGLFYLPVAFVNDELPIDLETFGTHGMRGIDLREVRL